MRLLQIFRFQFVFAILSVFCITAGCVPVDHWPVYDTAMQKPLDDRETEPGVIPIEIEVQDDGLSPTIERAEDGPQLSVEQAVMLALRYNRDLHVQQLSPVIAGTFEQIERGRFDPELFAEGQYFKEKFTEKNDSNGGQEDAFSKQTLITAGVRQSLPSGTSVEAGIGQDRTFTSGDPDEQKARLSLSVTQSLLQGFGAAVNLASVRQAELETLASVNELRGFTESLLADTETAYWQYVLAEQEIAIFEQSLAVARKQREEIELSIEVGLLPEFEVAAALAEEALRVQALINARSQQEESRLRLLRLISPTPDGYFERQLLTTSEPRILPRQIVDLSDRLRLAELSRADLNEARLRLQQNRLETIITRNGLLPRLDLFITLGKTGYGDTFSDSFRELNDNTYDLSAGLRLSHIIGNRAGKARNLASYATKKQTMEAIANLLQIVHLDVRLAVNEVERLRQQIDASRATRTYQEQTMNAEKERFAVGTSTALQVAQAQRDLLLTQIAEVEAIVNYRIALVQLYLAEGSLLERRGVQVK